MTEIDPIKLPTAPLPTCGDQQIETDFDKLPLNLILGQALGYDQYPILSINDLEIPDFFNGWQPEALHDALCNLTDQLRDALPENCQRMGEAAVLRTLDLLDASYHSMAAHLFKLGYLFGRKQTGWEQIKIYSFAQNAGE